MADREVLTRVAYLYYERGLKQKQIAQLMGLSPSKVSRLLAAARKSGIVEIHVPVASSFSAAINWRRLADMNPNTTVTVHVMMIQHSLTESLLALIPEFERLTGIKVLYHLVTADEYMRKLAVDLSSRGGLIDVFMTGHYIDWQYIHPGWIEPLDGYLQDPNLTDAQWYDLADFYPESLAACRWDGRTLGQGAAGTGNLYAIPATYEIMSLAYRVDLFEEAGINVSEGWPHTWNDLLHAARKLTSDTNGDGLTDQCGIISRGADNWESMFGGYSNIFYSYGGIDFGPDMQSALLSEQSIEATTIWMDMMRTCASPNILDLHWFQVQDSFAAGTAAMIIDCDWFAPAVFENHTASQVAGKLAYAMTPPGPDGNRVQDSWFWSLAMNSASYHKEAAWLFIQWATSKPVMLQSTLEKNNWNPPRKSVWEHPETVAKNEQLGNYRQVVEESRKHARITHSVNPCLSATHDVWWSNMREAMKGKISVTEALTRADHMMNSIMSEFRARG